MDRCQRGHGNEAHSGTRDRLPQQQQPKGNSESFHRAGCSFKEKNKQKNIKSLLHLAGTIPLTALANTKISSSLAFTWKHLIFT